MRSASSNSSVRGFTLIECLVAVVILSIGIVGVMLSFQSIGRGEDRTREIEKMQRLAADKFAELRATTDTFSANDSGDFQDRNEPDYTWSLQVDPTGTQNLDAVTITVQGRNASDSSPDATYTQLIFQPPPPTDTTGGTTGGAAG